VSANPQLPISHPRHAGTPIDIAKRPPNAKPIRYGCQKQLRNRIGRALLVLGIAPPPLRHSGLAPT